MGVDDDDDYEEGIPDFENETLIRSKLKHEEFETELRRKALSKILNQVGVTFEAKKEPLQQQPKKDEKNWDNYYNL